MTTGTITTMMTVIKSNKTTDTVVERSELCTF
jgi:hypothetical protein